MFGPIARHSSQALTVSQAELPQLLSHGGGRRPQGPHRRRRRRRRPLGPHRRRRREAPGLHGGDAGRGALEPGQRKGLFRSQGEWMVAFPRGHTPESSEKLSGTRPDLWPRQMGLTEHPGGPWGPSEAPRRLRVVLRVAQTRILLRTLHQT